MSDEIKSGLEILDEYFKNLSTDDKISKDLRSQLLVLWEQKKLTKTSLSRMLDDLRKKVNE
ncbi:MAG: hypothetical protein Q8O30_12565 [Candidatus Omnitrophota bacterium]|nr:hypothetical protein [Candidatus Omnitrophota bacterium]